jgi:hypothetical protein
MLDAAASLRIATDHLARSDAVASLRTAADCLARSAIPEAVVSLRAVADSLETRLDSPTQTRKRLLADAASGQSPSQRSPTRRRGDGNQEPAAQSGTKLTRELLQVLEAWQLTGPQKHRLVTEVARRESLGLTECAWGKDGGIITTENRCTDPKCAKMGRTHKAPRQRLTPDQRWTLYEAVNVTHILPPSNGAKKQKR